RYRDDGDLRRWRHDPRARLPRFANRGECDACGRESVRLYIFKRRASRLDRAAHTCHHVAHRTRRSATDAVARGGLLCAAEQHADSRNIDDTKTTNPRAPRRCAVIRRALVAAALVAWAFAIFGEDLVR